MTKKIVLLTGIILISSCLSCALAQEKRTEIDDMFQKGKMYLDNGEYDKAINHFEGALLEYPDVEDLDYYLGFLYFKKGEITKAEEHFLRVIEKDPFSAEAYYYLGIIENRRGNYEQVIDYLDKVTSLDDRFHSAYFNKGITYLKLDMPKKAVQEFGRALSLMPTDTSSFQGIVEAYKKMDLIEINTTGGEGQEKLQERKKPTTDEFNIFVESSGKEVRVNNDATVTLKSVDDVVKIKFPQAVNFINKALQLEVKGTSAKGNIKVVVIDKDTKRSPVLYISPINKKWREVSVNIQEKAGHYLDAGNIKNIRIELDPETYKKGKVYIKGINIR